MTKIVRGNIEGIINTMTTINDIQEQFSRKAQAFLSLKTLEQCDKLMREVSALKNEEYTLYQAASKDKLKIDKKTKQVSNMEEMNAIYANLMNEEVELKTTGMNIIVTQPELIPLSVISTLREVFGEENVTLESSRVA